MCYYKDKNDLITQKMILDTSSKDYWEESENNVISHSLDFIKEIKNERNMLDIGCGDGRLFQKYYNFVEKIVAIEPDHVRYCSAKKTADENKFNNIIVINGNIDIIKNEKFNIILCSHVIQHIPETEALYLFARISKLLEDDGVLILLTTFTPNDNNKYMSSSIENNKYIGREITSDDFNDKLRNTQLLLTCLFSHNNIERIAKDNGLNIVSKRYFHYINADNAQSDLEKNIRGDVNDSRDVMYILKKKPMKAL